MTTQENTKLAIKIGFKEDSFKYINFTNIVNDFLNINPDDENDVYALSNKYRIIPRDLREKFLIGFKVEYKRVQEFITKFKSNTLSTKDIKKINKLLNDDPYGIEIFSKKQLEDLNHDQLIPSNKKSYYLTQQHIGFWGLFDYALLMQLINVQTIRKCLCCSKFYSISNFTKKQIYCCQECRYKMNKRISRKRPS